MAKAPKYAHLKGRIPEAPTEKAAAVIAEMKEFASRTIVELTALYNAEEIVSDDLASKVAKSDAKMKALEALIRGHIKQQGLEAVTASGFHWGENVEPYPVCEDPAAIKKYFRDHGMEDQLELKSTELATRLKTFVKEEAAANELDIQIKEVDDPEAPGGKREVTEVRSKIPGVKVFLAHKLSRTKSSKGA